MSLLERTIDEERERRLIEGLKQNDRECFQEVYRDYAGLAYGLAVRVLGTGSEAEDVVQESFLALWRQAERLDPERGLRSYLMTIVHHKAIDGLRARGRRREQHLEPTFDLPADTEDPQLAAERTTDRELVLAAMSDLPQDQRMAIELTYFRGLTINEAAQRLQVPLGTVKSRLRLALGRLRRSLEAAT